MADEIYEWAQLCSRRRLDTPGAERIAEDWRRRGWTVGEIYFAGCEWRRPMCKAPVESEAEV